MPRQLMGTELVYGTGLPPGEPPVGDAFGNLRAPKGVELPTPPPPTPESDPDSAEPEVEE
jgi:hypothetical protein